MNKGYQPNCKPRINKVIKINSLTFLPLSPGSPLDPVGPGRPCRPGRPVAPGVPRLPIEPWKLREILHEYNDIQEEGQGKNGTLEIKVNGT